MLLRSFSQLPSPSPAPSSSAGEEGSAGSLTSPATVTHAESRIKPPRLLLAGVVVVVGVALAAAGRAENRNSAGTVTAVAGPVTVARLSGSPQPLKFRDSLFWRDVVESRKDGIARLLLAGKTTVTVRELSRLELREEAMAEGMRYTAELISGKVRASVARVLMRPGDQVEIRTKNAVASVRGTDFIVETLVLPSQGRAFGLLGVRAVAQAVADGGSQEGETVVVTLSGAVNVTNRLSGTGRVEHVRAYEAVRVSGRQDPLPFQVRTDDLRVLLQGLTPPRPQEARSGDKSEAVGTKIELAALAASARSVRASSQAGGHDQQNGQANGRSSSQSSQAGGTGEGPGLSSGGGQGNAPATPATGAVGAVPASPGVAAVPAIPAIPAVPATPATGAVGAVPATPATPATPAVPARPGVAAVPAIPATPAVAATPAVPASPATPATPAAPAAANRGGGHGTSRGNQPGQGRR